MRGYARLPLAAHHCRSAIFALRQPRPPSSSQPGLSPHRAWLMGVALLRLDFRYGDLIRWLGGEYTNQHRDWGATFEQMLAVQDHPILPGFPIVDFTWAERICLKGIPPCSQALLLHECPLFAQLLR